jgi:Zn-dependent protease with chaperone function
MRIGFGLGLAAWIVAAVLLWRTSVPSLHLGGLDPHRYFSRAALDRARSYGDGVRVLWVLAELAALGALAVLVWRLPRSARRIGLGRVGTAIVIGMVVVVTLWFVSLPFAIAGLWWQAHHGLGPFDPASWLLAQWALLSSRALAALVSIAIAVALAVRFPRGWWVPAAAVFVAIAALLGFLSGWLGASGTRGLEDPRLRADVARIETAEGVHPPVRVLKVSDWTDEPNAFTAGFAVSTHVVVWNTMLDGRFSRREIAVVVAHEVGHARSRHILKGVGWYALFAFPAALLIAFVTGRRGGLRNPANLPLAVLVLTVANLVALPLQNAVSRRYEAEADWRALTATHDPAAARRLFEQFVPTTLSEPDPPAWDYAFLENHPTIAQRIAMANAFSRAREAGAHG